MKKFVFIKAEIDSGGLADTDVIRDIQDAIDHVRVINGYKIYRFLNEEQANYVVYSIEDNPI